MKKIMLVAMAFVLIAVGTFADQKTTVAAPKVENVYTYYLEGDCNTAIECSPEFDGAICEQLFEGSIVYYQPGCQVVYQTANVIGKRQP